VSYKSRIRWFHEWFHTLEYGPQWWERPCASHPGHARIHSELNKIAPRDGNEVPMGGWVLQVCTL
jgi:hypothetical protein